MLPPLRPDRRRCPTPSAPLARRRSRQGRAEAAASLPPAGRGLSRWLSRPLRRAVLLRRRRGPIDMSLRTRFGRIGGGWALGVGRYTGEDLHWYRRCSRSP